jgi:hypothetical protein
MDEETRAQFEAAVERKKDEARARSHDRAPDSPAPSSVEGDQHSLISADRKSQDVYSVRDKNSGKGHKTADKWNQ